MSVSIVTTNVLKVSRFVNHVVFGKRNLLLTNALISTLMGTAGDAIQQNYDIMSTKLEDKQENKPGQRSESEDLKDELVTSASAVTSEPKYNWTRTAHMSAAGLTTGLLCHYWYIWLDKFYGPDRVLKVVLKKVLVDQIFLSPVNLAVYFTTVGILERSKASRIKDEIIEKGMENIYVVEWMVWPPAQFVNFLWVPLKYRLLFDNVVSLGFDIYSPFVKYKTQLKAEKDGKSNSASNEVVKTTSIEESEFEAKILEDIDGKKTKKTDCEICNNNECQIS